MRKLAKRTDQLIRQILLSVKPGMTELQVANQLQSLAIKTYEKTIFYKNGVKEEFAWADDSCPIVLSGNNIAKGGHTKPSNKVINKGEVIYIDFGLRHTYPDHKVVNSDLQRVAFIKNDDDQLYGEIQNRFKIIKQSIAVGYDTMAPGIKGCLVDEVVRSVVTENGYPDYPHSSGHPIGVEVHKLGALLSCNSARGRLEIMDKVIYTIEPRIQMENGVSIEEMILVSTNKNEFLCPPHDELIVIAT